MLSRPMRFGEMIDGMYRSLRNSFWQIWGVIFLINTPVLLLLISLIWYDFIRLNLSSVFLFAFFIYTFIFYPVWQNGCTKMVMHQIQQRKERLAWYTVLRLSRVKIFKLVMANGILISLLSSIFMMVTALIGLPMLLFSTETTWHLWIVVSISGLICFFPLTYLWIRFSLVLPVLANETISIIQAYKRSWSLTRHTHLALYARWMAWVILQLPFVFIWMVYMISVESPQPFWIIISLLITPIPLALGPIFLTLIYVDQRMRKEAFDLQLRLMDGGETRSTQI